MICAIGLDWKNTSLEQREYISRAQQDMSLLVQRICALPGVKGCVALQTCNRFEFYIDVEDTKEGTVIFDGVAQEITQKITLQLFLYEGVEAHRRLMEVACGMQSQILGEDQIITQVREAVEAARCDRVTTPELETLFRLAVTAGKSVRTEVKFRTVPTSCAHKAVEIAKKDLGSLTGKTAVVIGNGEMGRLAAELLVEQGCRVTITLRSYRHGKTVVPAGCETIPYKERFSAIEKCDFLVSATKSMHFTVTAPQLSLLSALPRVVVDMALPRDIDPLCREIPALAFYDMDDLRDTPTLQGSPEFERAQSIIHKHLADHEKWVIGRKAYREQGEEEGIKEQPSEGRLALFAGTSEGRLLCEHIARAGISATVFVATEYGSMVLPELPGVEVRRGRLDEEEMGVILQEYTRVVDATHPYAVQVSSNLRKISQQKGIQYMRVIRSCSSHNQEVVSVPDASAAAAYLAQTEGPVLLTTGSKELSVYKAVPDYAQRVYLRLLPDAEAIQNSVEQGFLSSHLIGMQGPFSHDLNVALMRSIKAQWLVTKDTGRAGGFLEKLSAAQEVGARVIVIARPEEQVPGHTLEEACEILTGSRPTEEEEHPLRFPLFVNLEEQPCLVVGSGPVGLRRCRSLQEFGAHVTLIAPDCSKHSEDIPKGVSVHTRECMPGDVTGMTLVVAATDRREVNHAIAQECKAEGIPVSVADCAEECSFYFPALCKSTHLTAGIVSRNNDHALVAEAAAALRKTMEGVEK